VKLILKGLEFGTTSFPVFGTVGSIHSFIVGGIVFRVGSSLDGESMWSNAVEEVF
jgi:hypothetical protein